MKVESDYYSSPLPRNPDVSWFLLLITTAVIVGPLYLIGYGVIYTEGEVMQGLFYFLVCLTAGSALLGFYRRRIAIWCVVVVGGFLLLWQTYQIRRWGMMHEDVIAIVQYSEDVAKKTGNYPINLSGYTFKHEWVKSHIHGYGTDNENGFRFTYFLNDLGVGYWYSEKTGFGYHPD